MTNNATNHSIHEGRNVKRFREMMGIKQDTLASTLGDDWNQQKVSLLEQKENIDPVILQQVSLALGLPIKAFQDFDDEQAINIINNTFHDQSYSTGSVNYNPVLNFNPLEKWLEALDELKRLNVELLEEKESRIKLLQGMLETYRAG